MNLGIGLEQLMLLLLILTRVTSLFLIVPIFGMRGVPAYFKIGLAFFVSLTTLPTLPVDQSLAELAATPLLLLLSVVKEIMMGLVIGYVCLLMFSSVQVAGQFIDIQIGFSIVNVIDPQSGYHVPIMGSFKNLLAVLLFLGLDGHYAILTAVMQSFQFVPPGAFLMTEGLLEFFLKAFTTMFLLAVKISMPVVIALFLTDMGFAIMARTVPQMNIFIVGMPFKILFGFFMMILVMPFLIYFFRDLFHFLFQEIDSLLHLMGGRP